MSALAWARTLLEVPKSNRRRGSAGRLEAPVDHPLQVTGPSELIAVIPHVFGFVPEESVVLAPRHGSGPWARLDQPYGAHDISEGAAVLAAPFLRDGVGAALVCFTTDREAAEGISVELARRFTGRTHLGPSLWVDAGVWTDLVTGVSGRIDGATRTWADAELALAGRRMPVASRDELRRDLEGDSEEVAAVAAHLPDARVEHQIRQGRGNQQEARWVDRTVGRFLVDQVPVTPVVAARLLVDMEVLPLRDVAWMAMNSENAALHMSLWRDLTRRAPHEARTPAATLLAFSSWLAGQGAHAWVALDLVPEPRTYSLARIVESLLEGAIPPSAWDTVAEQNRTTPASSVVGRAQATRADQPGPSRPYDPGTGRGRPSSPSR
jgi:hypothetical protein